MRWRAACFAVTGVLAGTLPGWAASEADVKSCVNAEPDVADLANSLLDRMNFGMFYNKDARPGFAAGWLRGGFWDVEPLPPPLRAVRVPAGCDVPGRNATTAGARQRPHG